MKSTRKTGLAALLLLLSISCTKQNSQVQSSATNVESAVQAEMTESDAPANIVEVTIGTQVWMKRNLHVSRYRNGDRIPHVTDPSEWAALTTGAWCWYNNDSATGTVYGKLYNWYAVNDPRGLAPEGWHVASNEEWTTLSAFLGGDLVSGGKLKEAGTSHWLAPNKNATNSSRFKALPGGYRVYDGYFVDLGDMAFLWSSTEEYSAYGGIRNLFSFNAKFPHYSGVKGLGCSVRCVKD